MAKEVTARAATIDEAVAKAVAELGVARECCEVEILEAPRKTLFGKLKEAVVRVAARESDASPAEQSAPAASGQPASAHAEKLAVAERYLDEIFAAMGLSGVERRIEEKPEGAIITLSGEGLAVLIGHHGETLDALQYLVALTCNRIGGDYYRMMLDCGNYREKREVTLQNLAGRIAQKVKKSGRSQLLEPMNPYERRIIHSVVSAIDGVTSKSKGEEPNRRVVILNEQPASFPSSPQPNRGSGCRRSSAPPKREVTMEEILKGEFKEDFREREETAELYSKIEL